MNDVLDKKIENVLDQADRMFIATSVGGNSSGASVFFSRDGEDLVFFTFHPTRKAEQIRLNPRVHVVIWPKGQEGIGRAFFCTVLDHEVVILHGFIKKTDKTPKTDLEIAKKRMREVKP